MKKIVDALQQALNDGVRLVKASNPMIELISGSEVKMLNGPDEAIKRLLSSLSNVHELRSLEGAYLNTGSGSFRITVRNAAEWLIDRAQAGHSLGGIVEHLLKFIQINKSVAYQTLILSGIEPTEYVQLAEDIDIVPFTSLPASASRGLFKKGFIKPGQSGPNPQAGLRLRYEISPAITATPNSSSNEVTERVEKKASQLNEIINVLTLIGPSAPTLVGQYDDTADIPLEGFGGVATGSIIEIPPTIQAPIGPFSKVEAEYCVNMYLKLPPERKKVFRVPLERLNNAVKRHNDINRAIELGIALEALLLEDVGPNAQLSLTLRIRGAWLIGRDFEHRKKVYDTLNKLYGLRSSAVHGGEFKKEDTKDASSVLKESLILCSDLILKMMEINNRPTWKDIILGGHC